jgi:hypothetical protein
VIELAAHVSRMTENAKNWVDRVFPMRRRSSLDKVSDGFVDQLLAKAFGPEGADAARGKMKERRKALDQQLAAPKGEQIALSEYRRPSEMWSKAISSDFDVQTAPTANRVDWV